MSIDTLLVGLATIGPLGYLVAPGTLATLLTLPLVCMLNRWSGGSAITYFVVVVLCTVLSFFIIQRALRIIKRHEDPDEIILDDIVGCLLSFWMIPLSTQSLIVGCILFRCFAIPKWGLIKGSEELPGAWGILGDDVIAALATNILLRFML